VRCVSCGEVQWNLRGGAGTDANQQCRLCSAELRLERRRPGRRFGTRLVRERRDARAGPAA
jgi:hypothetical protein